MNCKPQQGQGAITADGIVWHCSNCKSIHTAKIKPFKDTFKMKVLRILFKLKFFRKWWLK